MHELRRYQRQAISDLSAGFQAGHLRQILHLPTGSGKTIVAAALIRQAAQEGRKSLFIVDRIELIHQAARHLVDIGLKVGVLQGDNTFLHPDDEVVVASIQTIRSRGAPPAGYVVIDEVHILHKSHIALMERWNQVPFVGLSATPLREDLGLHFSNLARGPTVAELTEQGYLVPSRAFCPSHRQLEELLGDVHIRRGDFAEGELSATLNRKELIGDIVTNWRARAADRQTLVFAIDIAHSKSITEDFAAEGVVAMHIDCYTPGDERRQIVDGFKAGEIQILSSVGVLTTGFDAPSASCGILARPTLSESLHMQQLGRLIRPAEGKSNAVILDHAGNTPRFGLPEHFRVPDLGQGEHKTSTQKRREQKLVVCSCGAVIEPNQRVCSICGNDRPVRANQIAYLDGELAEYGTEAAPSTPTLAVKKKWYGGFKRIAELRGFKSGWAYFKYAEKFNEEPLRSWRYLPSEEPGGEVFRWVQSRNIAYARKKAAERKRDEADRNRPAT